MKHITRWLWLPVFVGLRLKLAVSFPIFNDESIYAWWSRLIGADTVRGMWPVLLDGKQPGLMVLWSAVTGIGNDPILAIRLTNIGFGLVTAWLVFWLYRSVTGQDMAWYLKLIYAFTPGLVWFEGMALQEAAVMAVGTGIVALAVNQLPVDKDTFRVSAARAVGWGIGWGVLLSVGWYIKPTALFTVPAWGIVLVADWWGRPKNRRRLIVSAAVAVFIAWFCAGALKQHPAYPAFVDRTAERYGGVTTLIQTPPVLLARLGAEAQWLFWWIGPICAAGVVGLLVRLNRKPFRKLSTLIRMKQSERLAILSRSRPMLIRVAILASWMGVVLLGVGAGSGIFTARYIAAAYPLVVLSGFLSLTTWRANTAGMAAHVAWNLFISLLLMFQPLRLYRVTGWLPAVRADFAQYVVGWPSGWGVREAIEMVKQTIGNRQAIVLVRLDSGNPESAVSAYLWGEPRIKVGSTVMMQSLVQQKLAGQLPEVPVYYVSRGTQMAGFTKDQVTLVKQFNKPLDAEYVAVWEVDNGQATGRSSLTEGE